MLEVEAKVKVEDLVSIQSFLEREGAERLGESVQKDIYFNAPHRDFGETDEALRVRYADDEAVVTYKGPKIGLTGIKAREEINLDVKRGDRAEMIVERLGFRRTAVIIKHRIEYRWQETTIELDEVEGLGTYIEIEVLCEDGGEAASKKIEQVKRDLGIEGKNITASYLELFLSTQ